jgi:dUTP pyrophosphatase
MKIEIKKIDKDANVELPKYQTVGSAGMDICACLTNPVFIKPNSVSIISTGLSIALPNGYECQVRSRSGLAAKNNVFVLNSPGTIDSDYRGEIKIILANFGTSDFEIKNGDRIAQLVIAKYEKID